MNTYYCPHCDVSVISASFDSARLKELHVCAPPPVPEFAPDVLPISGRPQHRISDDG